jgi:hypothetical protein
MRSKAVTALAALLAAFGGAYIAAKDHRIIDVFITLIVAVVIGSVCLITGAKLMIAKHPYPAVLLMSLWIVTIIAIGAGLVALFLWLGLELPNWLTSGKPTDETKEISKILLGALTAYVGVLFTEDLDKGEGSLWPSAKTKTALDKAYASQNYVGSTRHYQAVYEDRVRSSGTGTSDGIDGWGLLARWKRAWVLSSACAAPR